MKYEHTALTGFYSVIRSDKDSKEPFALGNNFSVVKMGFMDNIGNDNFVSVNKSEYW